MDAFVILVYENIFPVKMATTDRSDMNVINHGNALDFYESWEKPTLILSDGAYGIGGFDGDPKNPSELVEWYRPHVEAWTKAADSFTSLFFWNTEVGWASTHSLLVEHGWQYVQLIVWDKGIGHIAGNVNGKTIRRFPVVTEVAALYVRPQTIHEKDGAGVTIQDWLRSEWKRSGLPYSEANKACGVKNAASRKYLAPDSVWYMPPFAEFKKMQDYANANGLPAGAPYFLDAGEELSDSKWSKLRSKWNHTHGLTNVWSFPALRNSERVKGDAGKYLHTNQKPLELMKRQIAATTDERDVVWEPFGGLCSASVAAKELGRLSYAAEMNHEFYTHAVERLASA